MSPTLKEIARRTGKSITTVSRALADYDDVSAETKALVRRVADELGYTPNLLAQRLQKRRSDTIGLILPTFGPRFSDPFFSEFLAGVGNMAAEHGYDLLVSTQPPGDRELQVYRQKVQSCQVDGFVIVRTRRQDARIRYLREIGFPFVAFGRTEGELDFPFVDVDGIQGMQLIGEHLIRLGHRRIACLAPPADLLFAFPGLLLAILVAAVFGQPVMERFGGIGRLLLVAGSLALVSWPLMARYVRSQTLSLRARDFVEAARAVGADDRRIIVRHILPNVAGLVVVSATLDVAGVIVNESVLSLLGLGIQPPDPSIGQMIRQAIDYLETNWSQVLFPSLVLTALVLSFSFVGDGLRDALDPQTFRRSA